MYIYFIDFNLQTARYNKSQKTTRNKNNNTLTEYMHAVRKRYTNDRDNTCSINCSVSNEDTSIKENEYEINILQLASCKCII